MTCIANRPIHESINEGESSLNNGSYQGEKIMERRVLQESTRTKKGSRRTRRYLVVSVEFLLRDDTQHALSIV